MLLIDPTHARQWIVTAMSALFSPTMRREFDASKTPPAALESPYSGPAALLVAGRADPLASQAFTGIRAELMRELALTYRTAVEVVDAGHFIHRERPEAVVAAVRRLLAVART